MTLLIMTLLMTAAEQPNEQFVGLNDLASLQWKNRIVVINDIDNHEVVLSSLNKQQAAIDDRDILWFVLTDKKTLSNYAGDLSQEFSIKIRELYQLQPSQVILIGKDGGMKSRFDGINLKDIFTDIDAMPMRQNEIGKN